jgi:membrane protein implicated in regulation of membrane protease activity
MFNFFANTGQVSSLEKEELIFSHQEACVVDDILPGKSGQVMFEGVYWRARTNSSTPLHSGQSVRVLRRKATTLWVTST